VFLGERSRLGAPDRDCPDGLALSQQGDGQDGFVAEPECQGLAAWKLLARLTEVTDVDRLAVHDCTPCDPITIDRPTDEVNRNRPVVRSYVKPVPIPQEDCRVVGLAEPRGAPHDRVKLRLDVGR
jgi:hypothetical protein